MPAQAQTAAYASRGGEDAEANAPVPLPPASGQDVPARQRLISVRVDGLTVVEALQHIAEKAELRLSYGSQAVAVGKRVTLELKGVTALEAMQAVLQGTELRPVPSQSGQLVLIRPVGAKMHPRGPEALPASARLTAADLKLVRGSQVQTGTIAGIVTDSSTGEPLPGVNVVIQGSTQGSATDGEGAYTITGVEAGTYTLAASFVGYAEGTAEGVQVSDGETTTVDFALQEAAAGLDEVVVVGYGEQRRRDLTGSVASVPAAEIQQAPATSVNEALQGRVAGVQVTQSSSAPGGGLSVRIRGSGSINASSEPLYVVDGFPIQGGDSAPTSGGRGGTVTPNALSFLNPDDIESIQILKDASATAIYGARGANGVVLIETKSGRSESMRINFESSVGVQQAANQYDVLNAEQFAQFANEWAANSGKESVPFPDPAALGEGTDWQDPIYQSALTQNHHLGINGSAGETQFYLSGSYTNQNGIIVGSDLEKYGIRLNANQVVSDRLNLGGNVTANRTINHPGYASDGIGARQMGATLNALVQYPVLPIQDENGDYTYNDVDQPDGLAQVGAPTGNYPNPVGSVREAEDEIVTDRILSSLFAEYDLLSDLSLRLEGGADIVDSQRDTYYNRQTRDGGLGTNGNAITGTTRRTSYLFESILNYNGSLTQNHALNLTGGFTLQTESVENRSIQNSNFVNDITGVNDIAAGSQVGGPSVGSGKADWTLLSWLGRANYNLMGRYLVTATARADGSSKFGANNKWGFFPSGAVAWRISEEPFLQGTDGLSDLKLRVSYGVTGNQEIGTYQSLPQLGLEEYNFQDETIVGYAPVLGGGRGLGNPDLKWERTRQFDVGLDAELFGGRLRASADYYRKNTDDLLLFVTLPYETGFQESLQNLGGVRNQGVELSLGGDVLTGPVSWSTNANVAANRNEVTDLGDIGQIFAGGDAGQNLRGSLVTEGEPIGVFWGYETDGIFSDEAEVEAHGAQPEAVPGDRRFVDANGDGQINAEDRTVLGNPEPDLSFGWTNDLRYGNLNLNVFLQGTIGGEVLNLNRLELTDDDPGDNKLVERWTDRWTPDNRDAEYPRLGTLPATPSPVDNEHVSHWIEDGSYLRLRNVTLSYLIPEGYTARAGIQRAQIYVGAQNLVTLTGYSGLNPDVNSRGQGNIARGYDYGAYPLARTYRVGVRLGL